jgi:hypothetical protein
MVEGKGAEERIALLNGAAFIYTRETKTLAILQSAASRPPRCNSAPTAASASTCAMTSAGSPR